MPDYAAVAVSAVQGRLGDPLTYYPPGQSAPAQLRAGALAIFNEAHRFEKMTRSGVPITTTAPAARLEIRDFPDGLPEQGGVLDLVAGRFSIVDVHPMPGGLLICPLHKEAA
jgi:hypothetical protein